MLSTFWTFVLSSSSSHSLNILLSPHVYSHSPSLFVTRRLFCFSQYSLSHSLSLSLSNSLSLTLSLSLSLTLSKLSISLFLSHYRLLFLSHPSNDVCLTFLCSLSLSLSLPLSLSLSLPHSLSPPLSPSVPVSPISTPHTC